MRIIVGLEMAIWPMLTYKKVTEFSEPVIRALRTAVKAVKVKWKILL